MTNLRFRKTKRLDDLSAQYNLVDTLIAGTDAMIDAGTLYLPREPAESIASYKIRLGNSTLAPYYKRTIAKAVGKAFARGINVVLPEPMEPLKNNVDGSGTSLETFAKQLLHSAINYGVTYILVDAPSTEGIVTIADVASNNIYPYMIEIKPTAVMDLKTDYIGSELVLTYFRFAEDVLEYTDVLTQVSMTQVKEFTLTEDGKVVCNIYRKAKNGKEMLYSTFEMLGFNRIPIVPVYGNKVAPFLGSPLLIDLAYMNVKHWRKQSDLDHSEHFGLVPILAVKGFQQIPDENGNIKEFIVSANTTVLLPENGAIEWTKADAAGIKEARESLRHLEEQMDKFGMELTVQQATGTETATGRLIDAAESNSILKSVCIDLEWSVYNAIVIAGSLIAVDASQTSVDIDKTFTVSNTTDITLLKDLFAAGILTREEVRAELATRKILMSESVNLMSTAISNNGDATSP